MWSNGRTNLSIAHSSGTRYQTPLSFVSPKWSQCPSRYCLPETPTSPTSHPNETTSSMSSRTTTPIGPRLVPRHKNSRSPSPNCPRPSCPPIGHIIAYAQSSAPHQPNSSNVHHATCYIASYVKFSRSQSSPELQSESFLSPVRHRNRSIDVYSTPYGSIIAIDSSLPDPHVKPNSSRHVCVLTTRNSQPINQSGQRFPKDPPQATAMCKRILPFQATSSASTHSGSGINKLPLICQFPQHQITPQLFSICPVIPMSTMKSLHFIPKSLPSVDEIFPLIPNNPSTNYVEISRFINHFTALSNLSPTLLRIQITLHAPFFP